MNNCIFCKIVKGEIPCYKIFENESVLAFLDATPVSKGHTLIIPKKHFENMLDTPKDVRNEVFDVALNLAIKYKKVLKTDNFNFFNASGKTAQQSVFHLHVHLVPRYENELKNEWVGIDNKEKSELENTGKMLASKIN